SGAGWGASGGQPKTPHLSVPSSLPGLSGQSTSPRMDHPDKPGDDGERSPKNKNEKILKLFFPVFRNCLCPDDTGTKFNRKDLAMTLSLRALSVATILSFGALTGAALAQDNPEVGGAAMFADKNIVENAVNSADHTTLVAAVQAAGLVETLSGAG